MESSINNAINFISSKDDQEQILHSQSDSTEVMTYDNVCK